MTPRQQFFVLEYLIDLNGTQAAIRAGYKPSHARSYAVELLRRPEIASAIRREMADRARRCGITEERVIEEYARMAFVDMRLIADWGPNGVWLKDSAALSDETAAAIAFLEDMTQQRRGGIRLKTFDKRKALEVLARILGLNLVEPARGTVHRA